jgi:peptidyl-prolyl cis-trans isomerase A (cyclophilin A)
MTWLVAAGCGSEGSNGENGGTGDSDKGVLMNPQSEEFQQQAPEEYEALFETSAGDFTIKVERTKAPLGADRFYNLVNNGFYDGQRFFRVVPGFVVQWGMHGDPEVIAQWQTARILDDPVKVSNVRGTLCFATAGPNTRTTQLFINLGNNSSNLDPQGFAVFGEVSEGMQTVDSINSEYGQQPKQDQIGARGNEYLEKEFPNLDYIVKARIAD